MNLSLLQSLLVSIQSNANAIMLASQAILEDLDSKTTRDPVPPPTPNCEEKRHPSTKVTPAPVMGHPARMICKECRTTFEEGVDGHQAV